MVVVATAVCVVVVLAVWWRWQRGDLPVALSLVVVSQVSYFRRRSESVVVESAIFRGDIVCF